MCMDKTQAFNLKLQDQAPHRSEYMEFFQWKKKINNSIFVRKSNITSLLEILMSTKQMAELFNQEIVLFEYSSARQRYE